MRKEYARAMRHIGMAQNVILIAILGWIVAVSFVLPLGSDPASRKGDMEVAMKR